MFSTDTQYLVDDNISEKIPDTIHCRCLATGRSGRLDCHPFIVIHHSPKTLILVENMEIQHRARLNLEIYREHVTCQSKPESCNSLDWFVPFPLTVFLHQGHLTE